MTRSRRIGAFAGALLCLARNGSGDELVPFRVEYSAPEGCTDARGFAKGVMARTRRARIGRGSDATAIVVRVERADVGFTGRLEAIPPAGDRVERQVKGDRCEEVVEALSFIAALALDPDATSEPVENAAPEPERAKPAPPEVPPGLEWQLGAGLYAVPLNGAIPEPGIGIGAFFEAASSGSTLAPSLRAFFERIPGGTVSRSSGSADFSLLEGGLTLCPLRFPAASTPELRPCLGAAVGSVHAEAHGVLLARQPTRAWFAGLASLRGSWSFAGPFFAAAELGIVLPLLRQHYSFDSGESVFDTPTLTGFSSLGVGVWIP